MFLLKLKLRLPLRWLACLAFVALSGNSHAINWNFLDGPFGGQPSALFTDPSGNTWAGTNGSGIFFRAAGASTWEPRPGMPTQSNATFTIDHAGTVYVAGSSGLYTYSTGAATWTKISGANGLPDQAAGGLATDAAGNVFAGMNQTDVYKLVPGQTTWTIAGTGLPAGSFANNLVTDSAGNLWASIYGLGVYRMAAGATNWLAISTGLTQLTVNALIVAGTDVYAGLEGGGVEILANGVGNNMTWVSWSGGDMPAADDIFAFALGSSNVLYAVGSGVVYSAPTGTNAWMRLGTGIESLGIGYAIAYSNIDGSLTLGNGGGVFVKTPANTNWLPANDGMTAATVYGLVAAANGDLYAATFGQGVQRKVSGGATWSEVDHANSYPVVGAIATDSHGTIYATPGGLVKRLVNGSWSPAGTSQNSFAYALAVDANDAVWAGMNGAVRRLPSGATAWAATAPGLPIGKNVITLAFDSTGSAYAGIYGGGVAKLPPLGNAWLPVVGGLDINVRVLARDPAGLIYAGTDSGVYKLVGSTWQKLANDSLQYVYALAFDANGDLYAGTDNDYVWRLSAGAWTRIKLGLGSHTVQTLTSGAGRIYAGTDGSSGSPSGAFALSLTDTVVEFYNTILDNFFITATAAEQDAILGGSAGPGWIMTGNVFSSGGATLVCRFYGSISPGPNSHFYTIDPSECQQLKDIQATTPPSQKRWNFESNDFASTSPTGGQCTADQMPVYRAYNNGFTKGIDSNHRITSNHYDYLQQLAKGWVGEGLVMCAPR